MNCKNTDWALVSYLIPQDENNYQPDKPNKKDYCINETEIYMRDMIKYFEEIEQYEKCNKLLIIKKLLINKFNRNPNNEKYSGVIGESVLYELKKNEKKTNDRTSKRN